MNQNSKGIVIAVPKKYEKICLNNIQNLRKLGCTLPVEIWEIGEEITDTTRKEFLKIEQLTFKNVNDFCDNSKHWKGFQVKAFVFFHSSFDEVLLCDADVIIQQNPEVLFQDSNYLKTGAYFFKDLEKWQFSKLTNQWVQLLQKLKYKKFTSAAFFNKRKAWLRTLLPEKSIYFPKEWEYIYWDQLPTEPVKEALQESGVVLMNRKIHQQSFQYIYELNNNHKETYQYIWGDKETFWIACLMANQSFYFNPTAGYMSSKTGYLTHDYNRMIFFSQKG